MSKKNDGEKVKKGKERSTSSFLNFILAVMIIVLLFNCISAFKKMNDKKEKLNDLKAQYNQALVLKNEYEYLLNEDNQLEYIERIARERYGYVAPGERAFYDSSLGK